MDEKTTLLISLNPGRHSSAGFERRVTVSPTVTSDTVFTPAMIYPTSPVERESFLFNPS